jgi:hypothetical protein
LYVNYIRPSTTSIMLFHLFNLMLQSTPVPLLAWQLLQEETIKNLSMQLSAEYQAHTMMAVMDIGVIQS